jgi:hypothetical protein
MVVSDLDDPHPFEKTKSHNIKLNQNLTTTEDATPVYLTTSRRL